jgi:hypothetical protein
MGAGVAEIGPDQMILPQAYADGTDAAGVVPENALAGGKKGKVANPAAGRAEKRKQLGLPSVERRIGPLPPCAYRHFPASFQRLRQPGDGSCFFASWANSVFGDRYDGTADKNRVAHEFRDEVGHVMTEQLYERTAQRIRRAAEKHHAAGNAPPPPDMPTYAQFQKKMHSHGTWADLVMISAVALRMHQNLYFFDDKLCRFYYGTDRNTAASKSPCMPWTFILWTDNHSHFDLIVHERPDGTLQHSFTLEKDAAVLRRLRRAYESSAGGHRG